jgi:predicted ATPase/HEAT repeat protein
VEQTLSAAAISEDDSARNRELIALLKACTVLITYRKEMLGTGFFVAPSLIITCAHVVKNRRQVTIKRSQEECEGSVVRMLPEPWKEVEIAFPDVALIRVPVSSHPCALLDENFDARDQLYVFGYSGVGVGGESLTSECEGTRSYEKGNPDADFIKFKDTQVWPGTSGSPLLNQRTGKVCGMVKRTRDEKAALGGLAVRMARVFELLPEVAEENRKFHQENKQWRDLADGRLAGYLNYLEREFAHLKILSPLRDIYIAQKVREAQDSGPSAMGTAPAARGGSSRFIGDLLSSSSRELLIITGGPGQGKSTMLAHQAREWMDRHPGAVSLVIRLRRYANERQLPGRFVTFLAGNANLPEAQTRALLQKDDTILLLDALDEVFNPDLRSAVVDDILDAVRQYPKAHMVVTTRPTKDYAQADTDTLDMAGFRRYDLEDFDSVQSTQFIEKWRAIQAPKERQAADSILRAMQDSASFRRLAGKPLLLTLAVKLGRVANRAQLYQGFAEMLLKNWDLKKGIVSQKQDTVAKLKMTILEAVALHVCDDEDGLTHTSISEDNLGEQLKEALSREEKGYTAERVDSLRDSLTVRDSMLEAAGSGYEFVHQTMLEYFCARAYCVRYGKGPELSDLATLFRNHWQDFRWDEILALICGILQKKAVPLIRELLSAVRLENGWRATWLGAICLSEIEPCAEIGEVQQLVKDELEKLLTFDFPFVYLASDSEVSQVVVIRTAAADRLARWRDERNRERLMREVLMNDSASACAGMISVIAATWQDDVTFDWLREMMSRHGAGPARIAAASELARRWRAGQTLDWLIETVATHEDPQIRFAACRELDRGSRDETVRAALVKCAAEDDDEYVREEALRVLGWSWWSAETAELLLTLAQTGKPWYVKRAAMILLAARSADDKRVRQLCTDRAANDGWWVSRLVAILSLRNWPDEETRDLVFKRAVQDRDPMLRGQAAYMAAEIWPDEKTRPFLRNLLYEEAHPDARPQLLRAILRCWAGTGLEEELEGWARNSPHPDIRLTAIAELAQRNSKERTEPLAREQARADSSPDVRSYCVGLVAHYFPSHDLTGWLRERAEQDSEALVQETAIRCIGRLRATEADREWLVKVAEENVSPGPANMAVRTIARRWQDERSRVWLMERMNQADTGRMTKQSLSVDWFSIQPGQTELQELARGWPGMQTRDFLMSRLEQGDRRRLEYDTVIALGAMLPEDEARDLMLRLLGQEQVSMLRVAAIEVLGKRFHVDEVRQFLTGTVTEDANEAFRVAAITALAGQWRDVRTRELLMQRAANDPSSSVRSSAISALGRFWNDEDLRVFFEARLAAEGEISTQIGPTVFVDVALRQNIIQHLATWFQI